MKTVQTMLAEAEAEVPRISPDEAKGLLGRADVLFLDVREPAEVATSGKVPGALAVPRGLVPAIFAVVAHGGRVAREIHVHMVLEVLADPWTVMDDLDTEFVRNGHAIFLQKPYTHFSLAKTVRDCLDGR